MDHNAPHCYEDDLESFLHVMAWVSFTFMESDLTPQARYNILWRFEEFDGEVDGYAQGGVSKSHALMGGQFYPRHIFKDRKVDLLLAGLAKLFSCRYAAIGDPREKLEALKTINKFDDTFKSLLGNESDWLSHGPKVQPVGFGMLVSKKQELFSTAQRALHLIGHWSGRTSTTGMILILFLRAPDPDSLGAIVIRGGGESRGWSSWAIWDGWGRRGWRFHRYLITHPTAEFPAVCSFTSVLRNCEGFWVPEACSVPTRWFPYPHRPRRFFRGVCASSTFNRRRSAVTTLPQGVRVSK